MFSENGTNIPETTHSGRSPLRHLVLMHPCTHPISHVILRNFHTCSDSLKYILLSSLGLGSPPVSANFHASRLATTNCFYYFYSDFFKITIYHKGQVSPSLFLVSDVPHSPLTFVPGPLNSFLPLASVLCRYAHLCRTYFPIFFA